MNKVRGLDIVKSLATNEPELHDRLVKVGIVFPYRMGNLIYDPHSLSYHLNPAIVPSLAEHPLQAERRKYDGM